MDSLYETNGIRVNTWVKLKNTNLMQSSDSTSNSEGNPAIRDTVDLIPIGAYYGKGSRTGLYGSYLMASYSPLSKLFYTVCKLGTGFSQKQLQELHDQNEPLIQMDDFETEKEGQDHANKIASAIYAVASPLKPDVWFKPTQIWEVQADCFTLSRSHTLGRS